MHLLNQMLEYTRTINILYIYFSFFFKYKFKNCIYEATDTLHNSPPPSQP
jgi:hypothetical protein